MVVLLLFIADDEALVEMLAFYLQRTRNRIYLSTKATHRSQAQSSLSSDGPSAL